MESTEQFVEHIHEKQAKDLSNKKKNGEGHPDHKLPNKKKAQHAKT